VEMPEQGTSKSETDSEDVEFLEPPPIPVVDLVFYHEDEIAPPLTPAQEDISEDTKSEEELLRQLDCISPSREESRETA
jgi:hypothetical protein